MDDTGVAAGRAVADEERWRSPSILGRRLRLQVARPRDHLVLTVTASECDVMVGDDRIPRLVPAEGARAPRLIVTLPPQHVLEQVFQEKLPTGDPNAGQPEQPELPAGARFSGPSRLAFVLAAGQTVDLTTEGILTAMGTLPLAVVPLAERRFVWRLLDAPIATVVLPTNALRTGANAAQTAADRVRTTRVLAAAGFRQQVQELPLAARQLVVDADPAERGRVVGELQAGFRTGFDLERLLPFVIGRPAPRAPTDVETALEVPSRLQLSPSTDGAWAHAVDVDETPGATVELWNTRLGVRGGTVEEPTVDEDNTTQRIVRAVWTRDLEHGAANPPPATGRSAPASRRRTASTSSTCRPGSRARTGSCRRPTRST